MNQFTTQMKLSELIKQLQQIKESVDPEVKAEGCAMCVHPVIGISVVTINGEETYVSLQIDPDR